MGGVEQIFLEKTTPPIERIQVDLPASKSMSNRALIIQKLSEQKVEIKNLSEAEDTLVLREALSNDTGEMWMNDAGTSSRFSIAYASITDGVRVIKGSERLSQRPMGDLVSTLRSLGAEIVCLDREGFLPMRIAGKTIQGGATQIDAHVSSQFISALMLIAPYMRDGLEIGFKTKPTSTPYLLMTKKIMEKCGAQVELSEKRVKISPVKYGDAVVNVEPDWSAASYFFSAVALNPDLKVNLVGLTDASVQGDSEVLRLYEGLGVQGTFSPEGLHLEASDRINQSTACDLQNTPDLAQTLAVTLAGLGLSARLTGLHTLKVKETDRILALINELKKFGSKISGTEDSLTIAPSILKQSDSAVQTYRDHRMAMAFAPLVFNFPIRIEKPGVVAKSFPKFFEEFEKLGIRTYT
jgi:3-phosphoshikimate 1-carboxyvinyltransferase